MSFERFKFTKLWTSSADFPTVETDEAKVRADMQLLHDESKDGLNRLMTALEGGDAAANLGAKTLDTGEDSTVQAVMAFLRAEMKNSYATLNGDRHTHKNGEILDQITVALTDTLAKAYGRLVTLLTGITAVTTTLGSDNTTIPTSKAVSDAMVQAGYMPSGGAKGQALIKASDENYSYEWSNLNFAKEDHTHQFFSVGNSSPEDTGLLWIDTTTSTGGLKYYDGSGWVHVPVAWS